MLLGIAVIVLLGFFLYHYRPRNLGTKFKQSILWSELAKGCFVCHLIFLLTLQCGSIIFLFLLGNLNPVFWTQSLNILLYPFESLSLSFESMPLIFVFIFPIISAWLTQKKLVEPLRKEKIPRQKIFHLIVLFSIMSIVGFFSFIFIEYLVWGTISVFGYEILLQTFMKILPHFSILIIGIGAVELSRFKLNKVNFE